MSFSMGAGRLQVQLPGTAARFGRPGDLPVADCHAGQCRKILEVGCCTLEEKNQKRKKPFQVIIVQPHFRIMRRTSYRFLACADEIERPGFLSDDLGEARRILHSHCASSAQAKNRERISSSPSVHNTSSSCFVGWWCGWLWLLVLISSFFIECSQPTSSVTLTW